LTTAVQDHSLGQRIHLQFNEPSQNPSRGQFQTGRPDWANLRRLGYRLFWGQFFENFRRSPTFWSANFHGKKYVLLLTKKWVGLHFGQCFHKLIWSPWFQA
jgi:hypothetical protein